MHARRMETLTTQLGRVGAELNAATLKGDARMAELLTAEWLRIRSAIEAAEKALLAGAR